MLEIYSFHGIFMKKANKITREFFRVFASYTSRFIKLNNQTQIIIVNNVSVFHGGKFPKVWTHIVRVCVFSIIQIGEQNNRKWLEGNRKRTTVHMVPTVRVLSLSKHDKWNEPFSTVFFFSIHRFEDSHDFLVAFQCFFSPRVCALYWKFLCLFVNDNIL